MRYFKAVIHYDLNAANDGSGQFEQVLYCCSVNEFPQNDGLRELFYSLYSDGKTYQSATWKQVREEDITTDEIHLL